MTIVLRQGEINSFKNDARYFRRDPKDYVQYEGHTYRVLNYVRHLTPCECFMRGLAWALSYITIIPALFCWGRINRLLNEARTKTIAKVVYVPADLQSKFEKIRENIKKIVENPAFIQVLIGKDFSLENYSKLKNWLKARDTLVVWATIAREAKVAENNLNILGFQNIGATVEKAEKFGDWCTQNAEKINNITRLSLWGNQLTNLPKEIGNLNQLQGLYLEQNELESLPKEIGNLSKLEYLSLHINQFKSLPSELGSLSRLRVLILHHNQLEELPDWIGNFSEMRYLSLNNNRLTKLPKEIGNLTKMTSLALSDNPFKDLPEEMEILEKRGCKIYW